MPLGLFEAFLAGKLCSVLIYTIETSLALEVHNIRRQRLAVSSAFSRAPRTGIPTILRSSL